MQARPQRDTLIQRQKNQKKGCRKTSLYLRDPDTFISGLRLEVEDLDHLSKRFKGLLDPTSFCFSSPSKMSDFIAVKAGSGISIHKDGKEAYVWKDTQFLDTASARGLYYASTQRGGVYKVLQGSDGCPRVSSLHPACAGGGKSIGAFMTKTALFVKGGRRSSAAAIMLNNKGGKKHVLKVSPRHTIVDWDTCDNRLGIISTIFTLGSKGSLSWCQVSKHSKILCRSIFRVPLPKHGRCQCLGVSHDAAYAAILADKNKLIVLKLGLNRRVEVISMLELSTFPKNIRCLGFYQMSHDADHGEAEKLNLKFLYVLGESKYIKSQIAFLTLNTRNNDVSEARGLVKTLPPIQPSRCVVNQEGGSWIVMSGTNALYAKVRLVYFGRSKRINWSRNSKSI